MFYDYCRRNKINSKTEILLLGTVVFVTGVGLKITVSIAIICSLNKKV